MQNNAVSALVAKQYKLIDRNGNEYLSDEKGTLGGHRKQKIYGRLDCPTALRFIANGKYVQHRVFFADEATALAAGYRPCGSCLREKYKEYMANPDEYKRKHMI